jgi:hypothetical protein
VTDNPKRDAIEYALGRWGNQRRELDSTRDDLVRAALAAGTSKHRIHVLTGIARTTIDAIVKKAGE